jgi:hypothetical protein
MRTTLLALVLAATGCCQQPDIVVHITDDAGTTADMAPPFVGVPAGGGTICGYAGYPCCVSQNTTYCHPGASCEPMGVDGPSCVASD